MPSTGFVLAGAGANVNTGDQAWANPGNITTSDDNRATVTQTPIDFYPPNAVAASRTSDTLRGSAFPLAVPTAVPVIIQGLQVRVEARAGAAQGNASNGQLNVVMTIGGETRSKSFTFGNAAADTNFNVGGLADVWGFSSAVLTAANVNALTVDLFVRAGSGGGYTYPNPPLGTRDDENPEVDTVWVQVTYAEVIVSTDVTTTAFITAGQVASDVTSDAYVLNDRLADVLTSAFIGVDFNILSPFEGEQVTTAEFEVIWDFQPGIQTDYRVRIYSDSALANLVYDSGFVASSVRRHTVPIGAITQLGDYFLTVQITLAAGFTWLSETRAFTAAFGTSVDVTGVVAVGIGGECAIDRGDLPGVRLRWTQIVPGGSEAFVQYDILRRLAGDTQWGRIATVSTVSNVTFTDYTIAPGISYQYAVLWRATDSGAQLMSSPQALPAAINNRFPWVFVHLYDDPTVWFRFTPGVVRQTSLPETVIVQPWGRALPTVHVGEQLYDRLTIEFPELPREFVRPYTRRQANIRDRLPWERLQAMLVAQTNGSVMVVRDGASEERWFMVGTGAARSGAIRSQQPRLDLVEVFFDEAV